MNSFGLGVVLKFTDNFSMGVGTATTAFNGLSQAIDSQASGITNTLTSLCSTASSIGSQLTAAITTPVASIAGTFLQYGVARASFVENATLAYTTLMGDQKEASAYLQELMDFAKTTPFTYETIANTAQQFMAYGANMDTILKSVGDSGEKFTGILQALGDAAGGLGQGESFIAEASNVLMNMKTLIDSGSSTTVNFQQLESRGLQASKILGNLWNVENASAGTISAYIKENNISYDKFITDLTKGIEEGTDGVNGYTAAMGGLMGNIKNTWTGALDTWKSSLKTAGKNLMDYNEDTGTYGFLTDMTKALNICSNAVKTFSPLLQPLVDDIRNMMVKGSSYLEELTKKWEKTPQETKDKIAKLVEVLVLLGPALLTVGKAGGAVSSVFGSFGGTLSKSLKFAFSPVGILTGLLAGLAGAFIYLWNTNDEFKEHIKSTFSGISEAWSKNAKPLKESLGRVGEAFLDLFKNVTELLAPAFKGIFDTFGDATNSSTPLLINLLNGLASAIQWVSDKVEVLNKKWNELPESTQDKISGIVGKIALLALGFVGLFKVFKSLKSASAIIDNIPFIGKKSKSGGSSGGLSGGLLSNPKNVVKTMGSIAIILGGAVLLIDAIGLIQSIPGFNDFLSTGIGTMNKLVGVIPSVIALTVSLGLLVVGMNKVKIKTTEVLKQFGNIAIVLGAFDILVDAVGAVQSIPGFSDFLTTGVDTMKKLSSIVLPVTLMTVALGLLVVAFDKFKVGADDAALGIANVAIIIGGFDVLVTAVGALTSIPGFKDFVNTGTQTLNQLFTTMKVFTTGEFWGLCIAVAALGAISPAIVGMGIAGLAIVIGGMGAIISAFGGLAQIPGFNDFLKSGGETLATLFEQVGKAVGALIGGFAEGITQALPAIAENLSQFGEKIQPFFNSLNNVPTASVGEFLVSFAEFMLMMTADQILSFFTGGLDFVGMGEGLNSFGNSAKSFFDAVSAYPEEGIRKASLVFQALQGMGNYDFKTGGLFQAFTGTTDMEEMGRQLSLFAPRAFKFFMYCVMYPDAGLEKAPKVFKALNGMGSYDFKTWGLAQLFTGTTDLAEMGRQLASFAPNAFIFFKVSGMLSFKELTRGKQVLETLTLLGDYDNKTWGLAQLFSGSTDIRTTGEQLADFAPNAYIFFKTVGLLSFKEITRGMQVLQTLTLLGDYDNKTWGLAQLFSGSTDIRSIGNQLKDFAPNAKEYYTSMGELSLEQIRRGRLVLENLALTGDYNNKTWGLAQLFTGSTDLRTLGQQLADFAPNAKTFYTELGAIDNYLFPRGREALEIIGTISDISNRSGGIAQAFTGNLALDTLGTQLASFGKDIKTYLLYVGQTSDKGIEKTPKVIESLAKVDTLTSIAHTNDKERLSSLGSGLSLFMINGDTFFSRASDISTSNSIVTLSKHLKTFLGVVSKFNVDALQTLINKINALNKTAYKFNATLGNVSVAVRNNTNIIRNSIVSSVNSSIYVLNQFANSGSVIGHNLMVSIANGIYSNAWQIQRAVQYAVDSMHISMPNISSKVTNTAKVNMPHLASGGLATSPTVALIGEGKDDEGVFPLNDDTFKRLARGIVSQTATTNNVSNSGDKNSYDYSVTFEAGSIQFNLTGASDADLEQAAEKIEKIILRRQEIRKMANR